MDDWLLGSNRRLVMFVGTSSCCRSSFLLSGFVAGTPARESAACGRLEPLVVANEPEPARAGRRTRPLTPEEQEVLTRVAEIVRKINYGTVVLVIQDGKVVQIEMAEKFRLR